MVTRDTNVEVPVLNKVDVLLLLTALIFIININVDFYQLQQRQTLAGNTNTNLVANNADLWC